MAEMNQTRIIQVSAAAKEDSFGTAAALDSRIRCESGNFPNPEHTTVNDQDLIGASLEPSDQILVAKSYTMALSQPRVKPHTLAFIAAYAMGKCATTTPTHAADTRKHRIAVEQNITLPTFTMQETIKTGIFKKYTGCGVSDFSLTVQRGANRMVNLSANLSMTKAENGAQDASAEIGEKPLNGASSAVFLGDGDYDGSLDDIRGAAAPYANIDLATSDIGGGPDNLTGRMQSMTWNFNNNPESDDLYRVGSGANRAAWERGEPLQTVDLDFDYKDEAALAHYEDQEDLALQWIIKGDSIENVNADPDGAGRLAAGNIVFSYGINLLFPKLRYTGYTRSVAAGKQIVQANFQVLQHATHGSVILDIFNQQAGYAG